MKPSVSLLVCGGRTYGFLPGQRVTFRRAMSWLSSQFNIIEIIEGGATGADQMARTWAVQMGIANTTFEADWQRYGRSAGPRRNEQMVLEGRPDIALAFAGGRGTADMVGRLAAARVTTIEIHDVSAKPIDARPESTS